VEETTDLLQKVQSHADVQLIEVLLTALTYSLSKWIGGYPLAVDVVHHGRETCFTDVDLTRTVGLCIHNVNALFDLKHADTPAAALPIVKEQFRRINHTVLGSAGDCSMFEADSYDEPWATIAERTKNIPHPDICFNYYGQVDVSGIHSSRFRPAPEAIGTTESRQNLGTYPLYCGGIINDGQFGLSWGYSENLHQRSTVEHLVEVFIKTLKSLIHN
jgi:hypothetical protein